MYAVFFMLYVATFEIICWSSVLNVDYRKNKCNITFYLCIVLISFVSLKQMFTKILQSIMIVNL